jgi:hypothetical protein
MASVSAGGSEKSFCVFKDGSIHGLDEGLRIS